METATMNSPEYRKYNTAMWNVRNVSVSLRETRKIQMALHSDSFAASFAGAAVGALVNLLSCLIEAEEAAHKELDAVISAQDADI